MENETETLNEVLPEILSDNEGALFGESHDEPALRQTLTHLMPQVRALGVGTLSLEISQQSVNRMLNADTLEKWQENPDITEDMHPESIYELIKSADKHGIKVIGHEIPTLIEKFDSQDRQELADYIATNPEFNSTLKSFRENYRFDPNELTQIVENGENKLLVSDAANETYLQDERAIFETEFQKNPNFKEGYDEIMAREAIKLSAQGVHERNEQAAGYIRENKVQGEKIIVLGGSLHTNREYDLGFSPTQHHSQDGLDTLLNIPAITVDQRGGLLSDPSVLEVGKITQIEDKHFEMILPENLKTFLKKLDTSSWPVQDIDPGSRIENPLPKGSPAEAIPQKDPFIEFK